MRVLASDDPAPGQPWPAGANYGWVDASAVVDAGGGGGGGGALAWQTLLLAGNVPVGNYATATVFTVAGLTPGHAYFLSFNVLVEDRAGDDLTLSCRLQASDGLLLPLGGASCSFPGPINVDGNGLKYCLLAGSGIFVASPTVDGFTLLLLNEDGTNAIIRPGNQQGAQCTQLSVLDLGAAP